MLAKCSVSHSVLERIWIKGSYLSQWLPQGERGPPKESKSWWIEILHCGSQFTYWFSKIKNLQKFSDHSEIFFCFTIHKKLNKSCSLKKKILFLKKKILSLKKTLKNNFVSGTHRGWFQCIMILTPYGVTFHPVVVIGLGKNLLFKSVLAHCDI